MLWPATDGVQRVEVSPQAGDGAAAWRLELAGGDVIGLDAYVNRQGTVVVTVDTLELAPSREVRVNVNDGAVYSARPERSDHDLHFVGDYARELAASGAGVVPELEPVVLRRDPARFVAWWRSLAREERDEIREYARELSELSELSPAARRRPDPDLAMDGLMTAMSWGGDAINWIDVAGLPGATSANLYVIFPDGGEMLRVSARVAVDEPREGGELEFFWLRWRRGEALMPSGPLSPCALTWIAHVADAALAEMNAEAAYEDRLLTARRRAEGAR